MIIVQELNLVFKRDLNSTDNEISLKVYNTHLHYDHTLYIFSSIYIFVTRRWPTVAETCLRQHNK